MSPDQWMQLALGTAGAIAAGAGCYAAIRADLARTRAIAENAAEQAERAHARIDNFFSARRNAQ